MIGLDTNVLLRYLQQDDPVQSAKANLLFASLTPDRPGFISVTALIELVWVMTGSYGLGRIDAADVIERLLLAKNIVVEQSPIMWRAVHLFRTSKADFADCLIERSGNAAGCDHTVTYDRAAARTAGMLLLR
jgi:predicted nucleic-acid-binding protein